MKQSLLSRPVACCALVAAVCMVGIGAYALLRFEERLHAFTPIERIRDSGVLEAANPNYTPFQKAVLRELDREVKAGIVYTDGYYDGGEPPAKVGVCSDVIVRSYRAAGVDLQKKVQEHIQSLRGAYKIEKPDPNIDHRRCRNLIVYFRMNCLRLPESGPDADWRPGDVVFWDTHGDGRVDHVGMIGAHFDAKGDPTIVHHWPGLPVSETDGLHRFTIKGHFRWEKKREGKYSL